MGKWDKINKAKTLDEFIAEPAEQAKVYFAKETPQKVKAEASPTIGVHLKLNPADLQFLDRELTQALRASGDERWQGNIYRPDLIRYLIEFYKEHQ
ncbi:hypothetical protein PVA45_07280 (plasmid) [Entomospira entomophila]|uniref:Uncharacterized protein n=1 Tax=Entomospira entomophila TaxID=2719988 RepID=A0A968KS38_9SPIO|nr:hypothetical protein [Entomospira entomophilus]NIZ41339.1 hypothetical protein [Entomospira entomophilus]WDI36250.1 hypothetical protein PVA45_07280 [Entomospira entomophilus]